MAFRSWRGTVGVIKPTRRPGSLEEFIRLLPEGIGVVPLFLDIREGTAGEFRRSMGEVDRRIGELVEAGVDLVHQEGAGFFMLNGFFEEKEIVADLQKKHGVPVITSGMVQVEAMQALGMRRVISVTRSADGSEINRTVNRYLSDAGFEVLKVKGMDIPFNELGQFSEKTFYARTKEALADEIGVGGIHILGSGWRLLDILELLEKDLDVPVVQAVAARVWAVQRRLRVREPLEGYGRLLREMPGYGN